MNYTQRINPSYLGMLLVWAGFGTSCTYQAPTTSSATPEKALRLIDTVYEASVHSLRCYADRKETPLAPPIRALQENITLVLDFDVLEPQYTNYQAYIILCNAEWQPSKRISTRFVAGINQYNIHDFRYGVGTRTPYVHYRLALPNVLIAGNYVVVVHKGSNRRDLLLTARFMVHSDAVKVEASLTLALQQKDRNQNHRLILHLDHSRLPKVNPYSDLFVYIRQNRSWLTMRKLTRPTRSQDRATLIYAPIYAESDFCAVPSFRRFDTRRLRFKNTGIARWQQDTQGIFHVYLREDASRVATAHTPTQDMNGQYLLGTTDLIHPEGDYLQVHFRLHTEQPLSKPVYVLGGFNHRMRRTEGRLHYDSTTRAYTTEMTLKQGYYEYLYWVEGKGFEALEGCWAESENEYEIMVYYIDRTRRTEPLVGYLRVQGQP